MLNDPNDGFVDLELASGDVIERNAPTGGCGPDRKPAATETADATKEVTHG